MKAGHASALKKPSKALPTVMKRPSSTALTGKAKIQKTVAVAAPKSILKKLGTTVPGGGSPKVVPPVMIPQMDYGKLAKSI